MSIALSVKNKLGFVNGSSMVRSKSHQVKILIFSSVGCEIII